MFSVGYTFGMDYILENTLEYKKWFLQLKDKTCKNRLLLRLARIENGNFGDYKQLDENLFELRCTFGGGLRIYYTLRGERVVLLLTGGNKSRQSSDIEKAKRMLRELE